MTRIKYITVVNNFDILNSSLLQSPYVNKNDVIIIDNTICNASISYRYNNAIEILRNEESILMPEKLSTWIVFCHQDFYIAENLVEKLKYLDENYIYGPIGAKAYSKNLLGKIIQTDGNPIGIECNNCIVDTLDAMCLIVNLNTIDKYNLRFDESLKYHFYTEDFCLRARIDEIYTKVLQMECQHKSRTLTGDLDSLEYKNAKILMTEKWKSYLSEWGPIKTTTGYIGDNPESKNKDIVIIGAVGIGILGVAYLSKRSDRKKIKSKK